MESLKEIIQTKLRINTSDLPQHRVDDLNELSDADIERARTLGDESEATYYLGLLVTDDNAGHLRGFVRSVVTNGEDHRTWRKRSVLLLLDSPFSDVLTTERNVLFNREDDAFRHVIEPDFEAWEQNTGTSGAFVFPTPEVNYRFRSPAGYVMLSPENVRLAEVARGKVPLRYRRWIASKIAAQLKFHGQLHATPDLAVLEAVAPKKRWTQDAVKALDGLLKELKSDVPDQKIVPGFYGPDELYV